MKTFKLPDLGEGLPDAIVREWYVKVGDEVTVDQPLVAMETAKALVDVPSPFKGKIEKLFGDVDDTINTGEPLVGFEGEGELEEEAREDTGTVVGDIKQTGEVLQESATGVAASKGSASGVKTTPAVRVLAKRLGVNLANVKGSGNNGLITKADVENAVVTKTITAADPDMTELSPVRKAMAIGMQKSHQEVVPATICDDADIHSWLGKDNITIRIIRSVIAACKAEPMMNAHFDGKNMRYKTFEHVNLGLAVDTPHGLYVPVLKNVDSMSDEQIRVKINEFKEKAKAKTMSPEDQRGATIILSNFGSMVGRYATPVVVPPMTAIVGVGRSRLEIVPINETETANHMMVPISLSMDHRAVTGGEAARFLQVMVESLA